MCADLKSAGARERKFTSPRTFSSSSSHDHRADCSSVVDETMSLEFAHIVALIAQHAIGSVGRRQPLSRRISYFKSDVSDRSDLSDRCDSKARSGKYKIPPSGGIKRYLACRAGGTTKGSTASTPDSGAISRRYPRVLQAKSPGSVLMYSTRAVSAARLAGASEIAPSPVQSYPGVCEHIKQVADKQACQCQRSGKGKQCHLQRIIPAGQRKQRK